MSDNVWTEIIIIENWMQTQQKKYEKMNEVLRSFRKVPTLFEEFVKDSNPQRLKKLLEISECLLSLRGSSQKVEQAEIQLFHRFYSRMREIVYSYLNFYINSNSYMFIREFLISVNKNILQFRPDSDPFAVIKSVSNLIIKEVKKFANLRNVSLDQFQSIIEKIASQTAAEQVEDQRVNTISFNFESVKGNMKVKRSNTMEKSLVKQLGLSIIPDLQKRQVEALQFASQEEMLRDCLNRNRNIQNQMKRYQQMFKYYSSKNPKKKNSSYLHFRPTIFTPTSASTTPKKTQRKQYKQYSFQKKRASLYEPVTFDNAQDAQDKLKQQVMTQIYETRQKCCLKKVVMVGTDLNFRPISAAVQNKRMNTNTSRWVRPRSVHKSKLQKDSFSLSMNLRKN